MSENLIHQNRQQIWQNFYSVAFVGTDKGTAQLPEISSRVNPQTQQLLQTIQAQSCNAAQGLLRQIATFNQLCRIHTPTNTISANKSISMAQAEAHKSTELLSHEIQECIREVVNSSAEPIFKYLLEQLNQANLNFGKQILPSVLNRGEKSSCRALIIKTIGEAGIWLAKFNPKWAWAASDVSQFASLDERWQHGNFEQKLMALQDERLRQPEKAREKLATDIRRFSWDECAKLLATFQIGLSDSDEVFLEKCLTNYGWKTREVAVRLLMQLPNSQYLIRGEKRLLISIPNFSSNTSTEKLQWSIEIPDEWTQEELKQAEIDDLYDSSRLDEMTPYLLFCKTVEYLPFDWWLAKSGKSAQELIEWAKFTSNESRKILSIWRSATLTNTYSESIKAWSKQEDGISSIFSPYDEVIFLSDNASKENYYLERENNFLEKFKLLQKSKHLEEFKQSEGWELARFLDRFFTKLNTSEQLTEFFSLKIAELIHLDLCPFTEFKELTQPTQPTQYTQPMYWLLWRFTVMLIPMHPAGRTAIKTSLNTFEQQLLNCPTSAENQKLQQELKTYQIAIQQVELISQIKSQAKELI